MKFDEYKYTDDIFTEDDWDIVCLKKSISMLSEAERNIIYTYADTGSQREVARIMGCSTSLINQYIQKIRNKIKKYVY